MIETIIQLDENRYPFDSGDESNSIKVQGLSFASNSEQLNEQKKKFQQLKNNHNNFLVNLLQIYQEDLILHLVYEYIPISLSSYLKNQIEDNQSYEDLNQIKKNLMRIIAHQLGDFADFLCSLRILTNLQFTAFGMQYNILTGHHQMKYFLGNYFSFTMMKREQLQEHYSGQRKKILNNVEQTLVLSKKSDYLPNFIIRGNKLIFTDELSQTTTKKVVNNAEDFDTKSQKIFYQPQKAKNFGNLNHNPKNNKWNNKNRQKRHKNSCNFDRSTSFQNDRLNRSFDEQSQISITQTKSIKVQIQHQKRNEKRRKNSYKFKITTCQQIQIDQDSPEIYAKSRFFNNNNNREQQKNNAHDPEEADQSTMKSNLYEPENGKKDYREKVKEAKQRAQALLNQYFKTKRKSSFKR